MKSQRKDILIILLSFVIINNLFSHSSASVAGEEVDDERTFDYAKGGAKGPQHWGEVNKEWGACKKGKLQSPIDLTEKRVKVIADLGQFTRTYLPSIAVVKNRGHDISIQWNLGKAGAININGSEYLLHQAHWHSPSEHTINGKRFAMELHMVHVSKNENAKYKLAVIGVLFDIGAPDSFLSKFMRQITAISDSGAQKSMGTIDPNDIKIGGKKYYTYIGSLTVPPCTEGVIWTVNKMIRTVSAKQVKVLRDAVHDHAAQNSRPVQAINQREIHLVNGHMTPI